MRSLYAVLWVMGLLALTGLALMFLYTPESAKPAHVFPAPTGITPGGFFRGVHFRGVHFWLAQLIVLVALAHLMRVVFVKTNRRRSGLALAIAALTGLFWFTGMLLPWDRLTDWLPSWADGLLGVYWTHTLALSLLMLPSLAVYLRRTRRDFMPGLGS